MQTAEVVLSVLRDRGRKGLPCTQLYRQMFNKNLYLLAYGNIYSNQGAMTPGISGETADGMSEKKIEQITELMRHERASATLYSSNLRRPAERALRQLKISFAVMLKF